MSVTEGEDPCNLQRFLDAQEGRYAQALAEIRRGTKRTDWMWYIFPQVAGLGSSPMSRRFAIRSLEEARHYLAHGVLGARYEECVMALQDLVGPTAQEVFGPIDALKLRSSLTLFSSASDKPLYQAALARWFGSADEATLEILAGGGDQNRGRP